MEKDLFLMVLRGVRWCLVFPSAFVGLIGSGFLMPPFDNWGPDVMLGSDQVPLYQLYLHSALSAFCCLVVGCVMAPSHRTATVGVGIAMLILCGAPFNYAFMQDHFDMPKWLSMRVYAFDALGCTLALGVAYFWDRATRRCAKTKTP